MTRRYVARFRSCALSTAHSNILRSGIDNLPHAPGARRERAYARTSSSEAPTWTRSTIIRIIEWSLNFPGEHRRARGAGGLGTFASFGRIFLPAARSFDVNFERSRSYDWLIEAIPTQPSGRLCPSIRAPHNNPHGH